MPLEINAFRLDEETVLVTLPGEPFVELGLQIKQLSPFNNTILFSLSNSSASYIPTIKAFEEGSYEVVYSILAPGAGEMLVYYILDLLKTLK